MSIHIVAKKGSVAEFVLLCGDPLRAKHIAQTFFTDSSCYNEIRGMYGYTGLWQGHRVSVQGTGMGMPSFSIYAHELIADYKVRGLIRVGTCGTISEKIGLKEIIIAQAADNDGGINESRFGSYCFAPCASFSWLHKAYSLALEQKLTATVGTVFTSDQFYDGKIKEKMAVAKSLGALAIEMETCELYTLAALNQVQALSLLTVSDSLLTGEQVPPLERQVAFNEMVTLALETFFSDTL
ncbi:purine-nucleoside phosphorylase [uncultured Sphaerochaeta sp.]|uniref:purine-nucleoside phosphorylase n=1 Tax=uncultured Sphaerochaeta sp. TaxID=886478 RepID=UPI002A0A646B|nr:purine-nucleoside phosphorylase [uncultured Sphaerochaeta sp.]